MNYNTDKSLWVNYLAKNPDVRLRVFKGQVWSPNDGAIGQFGNSTEAVKTLQEAGYTDNLIDCSI